MFPIKTEIESKERPDNNLSIFLCSDNIRAVQIMCRYTVDQVINNPFKFSSLVYQELLRENKTIEKYMFEKFLPIHLDGVKRWIDVISVIPEKTPFHMSIPKEVFPFLNENIDGDLTPLVILHTAKILVHVNNFQGIQGNSGFMLDPTYLHLSMADRLNDPFDKARWGKQIDAYLNLFKSDLQQAEDELNRVFLEKPSNNKGLLTEFDLHRIVAEIGGKKLSIDEEQNIIRKSLERKIKYTKDMITTFENNRNGLKIFEDSVWDIISTIMN